MSPLISKNGEVLPTTCPGNRQHGAAHEPDPTPVDLQLDRLGVVVVAAGSSTRMQGVDKVFADLSGRPVLAWCLRAFEGDPRVVVVAVVLSASNFEAGKELVRNHGFEKVSTVIKGGPRRQDSVLLGLNALMASKGGYKFIAIHDGARPFVDGEMIGRGLAAAQKFGAAVAVMPLQDTVKVVTTSGLVDSTPDRDTLRLVQTPQVFRADLIYTAHKRVTRDVTDDATMIELSGGKVGVFDGHADNIKITTPEDLVSAEAIAARRSAPDETEWTERSEGGDAPHGSRYGIGFDGHRLEAPGPLRLGGTDIPFEMRLAGHSDGDVLLHAIANALLGAAGIGDLGRNFPSSDPAIRGIDSRELLRRVVAMLKGNGWLIQSVDATIIAQRPRLAGFTVPMVEAIAADTGTATTSVNVKVTSTDGVGAIGEGQGIAAQAIAVVTRA